MPKYTLAADNFPIMWIFFIFISVISQCVQRLEFLGDAVLDYLITSYLYSVFPNLKPGQLTDLRSIAVNNNSFARLAVLHSLQSYIISDSAMLCKAIENYVKFVQLPDEEQNLLEDPKFPKVNIFILHHIMLWMLH